MGIDLNKGQIYATYELEHWWRHKKSQQVIEIDGPAGSGKTTIIMYFIEKLGLKLEDVLFVSYMGKAVSQMIRNKLPARTIHSSCYDCEKVLDRDEDDKLILLPNGKPKTKLTFVLKDKIPSKPKLIVIDEGYMVPEQNALDLLSFGIPVIVLGDTNQLPPVFGNPFFLNDPDIHLTEIMRQAEGDPIIHLSQMVLKGEPLRPCVYGKSCVIEKKYWRPDQWIDNDVIITSSNRLRGEINDIFRERILRLENIDLPNYNEKIICRKNNWNKFIKDSNKNCIYLTNGLSGFVDHVNKSSYNGKKIEIDFKTDFSKEIFRDLPISMEYLNSGPGENRDVYVAPGTNSFEYAYAITTHLSQGSQYPVVAVLQENKFRHNEQYFKQLMYTGITRAQESVRVVV